MAESNDATANSMSPAAGARANRLIMKHELPDQDSNLDKQNQNLLCYRYTIGYRRQR